MNEQLDTIIINFEKTKDFYQRNYLLSLNVFDSIRIVYSRVLIKNLMKREKKLKTGQKRELKNIDLSSLQTIHITYKEIA